jgi:hypothetical protein
MPSTRRLPLWVWLVATPLVLVLLAWAALAILLPPARATQIVRDQLAKSLSRAVRFDRVAISLWPPVRLAVRKFELAEPGGFESGTACSVGAIQLDVDALALLARRVVVRRLTLDSPALHLRLGADGRTNFDGMGAAPAPQAQAAPPPMDLAISEFRVKRGSVLVDDLKASRRTAFTIDTRMSLSAEQGGARIATEGETVVSNLAYGPLSAARLSDLNQGFAKLDWHVTHKGKFDAPTQRLALESLALDLGPTRLACSGLIDSVGPRARYDLKARAENVDLSQVLSFVSAADAQAVKGLSGRGRLAFDLDARGSAAPGAQPVVTGVLSLRDGAFRYAGAPAEVSGLTLGALFRPDTLNVPDLRATVAGQPVSARLLVWHFADPMVDFAVRGNLDLAAVSPMLGPMMSGPSAKLAGHAVVDVSGRGRAKDAGTLALGGSADLHDVSVEGAGLPKKVEGVNGRIVFSSARATVQSLTARAGQSSYTLDASVTRPLALMATPGRVAPAGVDFTFRSPYLDLAELLPVTPGAPFLPNAQGGGKVSIGRLKQGKLDVADVTADVKLAPAMLESPRFSLQGYGGTVTGEAKFDLSDTRKPAYAVKAVVDSVKADALLSAWTPAKNLLSGTLDTKLDFSGAGQSPGDLKQTLTLVGLASLADGRLGPGPALEAIAQLVKVPKLKQVDFRKLELPMRIEHGRIISDPVKLSGPAGDWRLAGALGFDGAMDYAVSITLPPDVVKSLGADAALAAGALADPQGRVLLDLHVGGTATAPRVSLDTKAIQARLAGRASEALAEQSRKLEAEAKEAARQALMGTPGDSTKPKLDLNSKATRDSLAREAKDIFKNLFGKPKPVPPPQPTPTPTPTPTPSSVPDTTQH